MAAGGDGASDFRRSLRLRLLWGRLLVADERKPDRHNYQQRNRAQREERYCGPLLHRLQRLGLGLLLGLRFRRSQRLARILERLFQRHGKFRAVGETFAGKSAQGPLEHLVGSRRKRCIGGARGRPRPVDDEMSHGGHRFTHKRPDAGQ